MPARSTPSPALAPELRDAAPTTTFARRVFSFAGIYGLVVVLPLYFLERQVGALTPPAVTHPEFYYGFAGVTVAWQLAFLVIGRDPVRFRPLMPVAIIEKVSFVAASVALLALGRVAPASVSGAVGDAVLMVLFTLAYRRTPER